MFLRLPGTSLPPPSPRFSRASHTTQGPVPSLQRSSSALTPTVTLQERRLALRSPDLGVSAHTSPSCRVLARTCACAP